MVAKEINTYKRMDLFAATLPLEALKLILSTAATQNRGEVLMVNDVSRVFFHAKVKRNVYVELPYEDKVKCDEGRCAKLEYSMYGTRDAAINWHHEYSQQLVANGFVQGRATPCVIFRPRRRIRMVVHGDDYVSVGKEEDLKWMQGCFKSKYEIKTKWLGPKAEHNQEVRVLNRMVTWESNGIGYEADPRHVEVILEAIQLTSCTPVGTPGTSTEGRTQDDNAEPLGNLQEIRYKALIARAKYLSPDRADIAFAVKELAEAMSNTTNGE